MPFVDHARQEIRLKVVYYGPGLGGKTTNLEHIHRSTKPEQRGKLIALNTEAERTLFFDLLPVDLGSFRGYRLRVHLCTVPGQLAQDRIRQMVLRHVDGIVLVVDSQHGRLSENVDSIRNLETNLRLQGDDPAKMPLVVQYNKRDLPTAAGLATLREALGVPDGVPQVSACAARGTGVFDTFKAIVRACLGVLGDPTLVPTGRSPSIIPGRHVSMFPDAPAPAARPSSAPEPPPPAGASSVPPTPEGEHTLPPLPTRKPGTG